MSERWLPISGFPDYEVSDQGRVRSFKFGAAPRVLRVRRQVTGHGRVVLRTSEGRRIEKYVHQLVLAAVVGPRPDGMEVRHLDGDPINNTLGNLKYGTRSENCQDRVTHGTHPMARKTHCKRGHEFTPENTYLIGGTSPRRDCRTCRQERERQFRERRKRAA